MGGVSRPIMDPNGVNKFMKDIFFAHVLSVYPFCNNVSWINTLYEYNKQGEEWIVFYLESMWTHCAAIVIGIEKVLGWMLDNT